MKQKIYILTLGQLASSNQKNSEIAFAKLVKKQSAFSPFANFWVKFQLGLDLYVKNLFGRSAISNYELGKIDYDQFKNKISWWLGIAPSENFDKAWKAMCEISDEQLDNIAKLVKMQQEQKFKLIIPSDTNEMQYNYILNQINAKLRKEALPDLNNNPNISLLTSFDAHTLLHHKLVQNVIEKRGFDKCGSHIISLHNKITKANIRVEKAEFESCPSTPDPKSWLKTINETLAMKEEIEQVTTTHHRQKESEKQNTHNRFCNII